MERLKLKLGNISDAIRAKTGSTTKLSLDDMATEIAGISTGVETGDATAAAGDILSGKTAYAKDNKITGTMPNLSAKTPITYTSTNSTPVIPGDALFKQTNTDNVDRILIRYNGEAGYLQPNTLFGLDSSTFGNATPNQVVKGATFTSASGTNIAGTYEGVELNFSVVGGTTQPTNPIENMIWVNTDVEITSWIFSVSEPSVKEEGMVWFSTSTDSNVEFNVLENNSIQVYPIAAKQYINGVWVTKTAKSYQNGQWQGWMAGAIFVEGKDYVGGFNVDERYGTVSIGSTIYIARDIAGASSQNGGNITYVTAKEPTKIDLFNELKYTINVVRSQKYNSDSHVELTVGFKDASGSWVCQKALNYATLQSGEYSVSLGIKGEYYFAINAYTYQQYGKIAVHITDARLT